jgi:hypothetical protein
MPYWPGARVIATITAAQSRAAIFQALCDLSARSAIHRHAYSSLGMRKSKAARDSRIRARKVDTPTKNTASQSGPFIR